MSHVGFDCYTVGRSAYNKQDWKHTREWMLEALKQFDKEGGTVVDLDIPSIYDHLAYSEYSVRQLLCT